MVGVGGASGCYAASRDTAFLGILVLLRSRSGDAAGRHLMTEQRQGKKNPMEMAALTTTRNDSERLQILNTNLLKAMASVERGCLVMGMRGTVVVMGKNCGEIARCKVQVCR